jgi:hypothetical protein
VFNTLFTGAGGASLPSFKFMERNQDCQCHDVPWQQWVCHLDSVFSLHFDHKRGFTVQVCWPSTWLSYFFFFLAVLGFEFRALRLLGRHSTLEPCLQPFLLLIVFQVGFSVFAWLAWDWELPTYVSHVAEVTDIYHHALLIC